MLHISVRIPTISSCASNLCKMCTSLGVTPSIEPCCAASTPRACFSDYVAGKSITYPKPTGPTGAESTVTSVDSNSVACASVYSISSQCVASTPDWNDLDFSSQLSCVCYTSGTFAPQVWDGYWSTCLAWISTANPSEYSLLGPTGGGVVVRTPCADYITNSGAFPSTTLPPTPGVSLTGVSGTAMPSNTKSSASLKLKPLRVSVTCPIL
jgi:hypothetical protein